LPNRPLPPAQPEPERDPKGWLSNFIEDAVDFLHDMFDPWRPPQPESLPVPVNARQLAIPVVHHKAGRAADFVSLATRGEAHGSAVHVKRNKFARVFRAPGRQKAFAGEVAKANMIGAKEEYQEEDGPGWGGPPIGITAESKHPKYLPQDDPVVNTQHSPFFVISQVVIVSLIWLAGGGYGSGTDAAGLETWWPGQTDLIVQKDCVDHYNEAWRWFTYQFSHVGVYHIGMNVILVLALGIRLELFHGTLRTAFMFQVGVFGGACCCFVVDIHKSIVGMSGGCYSLLGIQFGDIIMNFTEKKNPIRKLCFILLLASIDFFQAYLTENSKSSHAAHSGGFIAGLLIVVVIGRNLVLTGCEKVTMAVSLAVGIGLIIFSMTWARSKPPQSFFDDVGFCWWRQIVNATVFGDDELRCIRCASTDCIARWADQTDLREAAVKQCDGLWHD